MSATAHPKPLIVVASLGVLLMLVAVGAGAPLQPMAAGWFLLVCPGLALAPLLGIDDPWDELAVALGLSVALDIVVATGLMYAGAWSPALIVAVLAAVSLTGAGLQVRGWRLTE